MNAYPKPLELNVGLLKIPRTEPHKLDPWKT